MDLSVVICFYNMRREAPRSLFALSRSYQQNIESLEYEVIVVENGSTLPLSPDIVRGFGPEFRYHYHETDSPSPVDCINSAVASARGKHVMVMVDGAHICSPNVLSTAQKSFEIYPNAFYATAAMHLGPAPQNVSVTEGYNQGVEDALLTRSGWKQDGYQLFTIAGAFADNGGGWFGCLWESNCFALPKAAYLHAGGLDSRFVSAGGGMMNLDFFRRMVSNPDLEYVLALGEATFHQFHQGVSTNVVQVIHPWETFMKEYISIRGQRLSRSIRRPVFLGSMPQQARAAAEFSIRKAVKGWQEALSSAG